ncbi:MAG: hypothetical protein M3186_02570 [Actinomycetota bacterium]|nr:hypothetical protein [Actinomycetota bacterium]
MNTSPHFQSGSRRRLMAVLTAATGPASAGCGSNQDPAATSPAPPVKLQEADSNIAAAIGRAVVAASNVLGAVANNAQALGALDGNRRLDAAFEQAPSCEQLREIKTLGG